jgi:hypothetical protein
MTITRKDFRAAVADSQPLTSEQLTMVSPAPQEEPRRTRIVTYPTPDGPTRLGTMPTAPYGEDPHDPTTQAQARQTTTGMAGRLHEQNA